MSHRVTLPLGPGVTVSHCVTLSHCVTRINDHTTATALPLNWASQNYELPALILIICIFLFSASPSPSHNSFTTYIDESLVQM